MELTTPRLLLREFQSEDWQAVLAYQRDPRYLRFYEWTERTEPDVRAFVQRFVDQQSDSPRLQWQWAIVLPQTHTLIGNAGIRSRAPGAREGEIGYELAPEHWGRGYATEAARAVVDYGFAQLGLHRVTGWCIAENVASAHVLEKLGMLQEGRLREQEWFKGRWWDGLLYAVLEHEWKRPRRR